MIIAEILNSSTDFTVLKDTSNNFKVVAEINGRKIFVEAQRDEHFYSNDPDVRHTLWEVVFYEESNNGETSFDLTKNRGEFKVFALVKEFITQLIKKRDPDEIGFSADKSEGRVELYKKLLHKFIIPGYEPQQLDHEKAKAVFFSLKKK